MRWFIVLLLGLGVAPAAADVGDFVAPALTFNAKKKAITESTLRLRELTAKQPALLLYWIPAVQSSVEEFRRLDAFAKAHPKLGVRFVSVARTLDDHDRLAVETELKQSAATVPVVLDQQMKIAGELQLKFVPAYVGLGKAGTAVIVGFGSLTDDVGGRSLGEAIAAVKADFPALLAPVPRAIAEGDQAPDFTLPDLEGKPWRLADRLAKGRNVLVVFWSPQCPHCRREVPRIQRFLEKNPRLEAVTITRIIGDEDRAAALEFVRSERIGMPVLGDGGRTMAAWGVKGVPLWTVVDPKGKVLTVQSGEKQGLEGMLLRYLK